MPFSWTCSPSSGTQQLEEETSKLFTFSIYKMDGLSAHQFQGVYINDNPVVEDLLNLNILLKDKDIVDGKIIGERARPNVQNYKNTVRLVRSNNHMCYVNVNNINAVYQSFQCPICETFFNRLFNLEQLLTTCSERVKKSIRRMYIKSKKLCFRGWTLSVSSTQVNKNFFKTSHFLILSSFVPMKRRSKIQRQQVG